MTVSSVRDLELKLISAERRAKAAEELNDLLRVHVSLLEERLEFINPLLGAIRVVLKYAALAEVEFEPSPKKLHLFGSIDSLKLLVNLYPKPKHLA